MEYEEGLNLPLSLYEMLASNGGGQGNKLGATATENIETADNDRLANLMQQSGFPMV